MKSARGSLHPLAKVTMHFADLSVVIAALAKLMNASLQNHARREFTKPANGSQALDAFPLGSYPAYADTRKKNFGEGPAIDDNLMLASDCLQGRRRLPPQRWRAM
jgi:hypothetical protein